MPMEIFKKVLGNIDEEYPFSLLPKLILALLVATGLCTVIIGILFIWYRRKTSFTSSTMGNILKLIPSLKEKIPTLDSLLQYYQNIYHKMLKMLFLLLPFLNNHKPHWMNLYCHLYWYQNYKWPNHHLLFCIVLLLWIHNLQPLLQLITNLDRYHWKCLIVLRST